METLRARVCVWEVCNVYTDRVYEHSDVFLQRQRLKRAFNWGCSSDKQTARHRWTLKSSYKSKSTKVKADYVSTNKQSCIFLSHNGPVRKVYSSLASSWGQTPRGWADAGGGLAYTCFAICPFPVLTNALKSDHLSNAVAVSAVDKAADCPSRMQGRAGWMKAPLLTPRCQRGIIDDPDWTQQLRSLVGRFLSAIFAHLAPKWQQNQIKSCEQVSLWENNVTINRKLSHRLNWINQALPHKATCLNTQTVISCLGHWTAVLMMLQQGSDRLRQKC